MLLVQLTPTTEYPGATFFVGHLHEKRNIDVPHTYYLINYSNPDGKASSTLHSPIALSRLPQFAPFTPINRHRDVVDPRCGVCTGYPHQDRVSLRISLLQCLPLHVRHRPKLYRYSFQFQSIVERNTRVVLSNPSGKTHVKGFSLSGRDHCTGFGCKPTSYWGKR